LLGASRHGLLLLREGVRKGPVVRGFTALAVRGAGISGRNDTGGRFVGRGFICNTEQSSQGRRGDKLARTVRAKFRASVPAPWQPDGGGNLVEGRAEKSGPPRTKESQEGHISAGGGPVGKASARQLRACDVKPRSPPGFPHRRGGHTRPSGRAARLVKKTGRRWQARNRTGGLENVRRTKPFASENGCYYASPP